MIRALAAAAVVLCAAGGSARAEQGFLHRLSADVRAKLEAARAPVVTPPVRVDVKWKERRLGAIDLGAPLVALAAADLDGDKKAELYAVTRNEVVALSLVGGRLKELGRVAYEGEPAVPAPRDVVATTMVDGTALVVSESGWARQLRVSWHGKVLAAEPGTPGFALCPRFNMHLAPGRNYFGDAANPIFVTRCRELVDAAGKPLQVRADLGANGRLAVVVDNAARYEYGNVGVAFEIADVDRDGTPELIYAAAVAPGDPDAIKVVALGEDDKKPRLKKAFTAGGVAGIAVGDLDGDGVQDAIAAVRLVGSARVDMWRLD